MFSNYSVILWDFDGVIMDSMPVRTLGFEKVLSNYPKNEVEQLLAYHLSNGGLSRYVKFRYFFEQIRKETIDDNKLTELTEQFSKVMLSLLLNEKLLIEDSVSFIKKNYNKYAMHIVSGSDGEELRYICKEVGLSKYFISINGSPTPKTILVKDNLSNYHYDKEKVLLIGDSKNDYDASNENGIFFYGYNNIQLEGLGAGYIDSFELIS